MKTFHVTANTFAVCDDEKYMAEKIEKMAEGFFRKKNTDFSVVEYSSGEELLKSNEETACGKYIFMILMPALLIFLASEYINENVYGNTVTIEKDGFMSGVNPYQMLFYIMKKQNHSAMT